MAPLENKADYIAHMGDNDKKITEALKIAHDIRKFEIDLYWKRASYFWTIIGIAFAGFFAMAENSDISNVFIVSCAGFVISLAWYLVNRGGACWQRSWETHIDLLEDNITGPLHKTTLDRYQHSFWQLHGPYPYSPSKINALSSIFVVAVWLMLIGRTGYRLVIGGYGQNTMVAVGFITAVISVIMLDSGRTSKSDDSRKIEGRTRIYD